MRSCVWNGLDAPALPRSSHDFSSGRNREIHQAAARDPFARPHEYIISPLSQSLGAGKQQVNWRLMGRDLLTPVVMEKRKRKKKPIWPRRLRVRRQSWWAELGDVDKKGRDERTSPSFRARESDSQRPAAFFSCILFILLSKQQKRRCGIISKVFPCFLWKKVLWCRYKNKTSEMVKAQHPSSSTVDPVRAIRTAGSSTTAKEQVEIQMYLSKLKELVPHMPKNRKVSKLEVIQHVIDYICDLQTALEQNHPAANRRRRSLSDAAASILAASSSSRQPLGLLASIPNTSAEVNSHSRSLSHLAKHKKKFLSILLLLLPGKRCRG